MESALGRVPELIDCLELHDGSWPDMFGAHLVGRMAGPNSDKVYYTLVNLKNKTARFGVELVGTEFESLNRFKIFVM
jgi:hypothetical protein